MLVLPFVFLFAFLITGDCTAIKTVQTIQTPGHAGYVHHHHAPYTQSSMIEVDRFDDSHSHHSHDFNVHHAHGHPESEIHIGKYYEQIGRAEIPDTKSHWVDHYMKKQHSDSLLGNDHEIVKYQYKEHSHQSNPLSKKSFIDHHVHEDHFSDHLHDNDHDSSVIVYH